MTFLQIYSSSWSYSINMNKTKNLSLLSLRTVSAQEAPLPVPVLTIPTQDQESLFSPCSDCLCQSRVSSWSGGSVGTQDCSTQSWSCESWIFYGNFTVCWGPTWWATFNHCQSGYGPFIIKHQNGSKNSCFWSLQKIAWGWICSKLPKIYN